MRKCHSPTENNFNYIRVTRKTPFSLRLKREKEWKREIETGTAIGKDNNGSWLFLYEGSKRGRDIREDGRRECRASFGGILVALGRWAIRAEVAQCLGRKEPAERAKAKHCSQRDTSSQRILHSVRELCSLALLCLARFVSLTVLLPFRVHAYFTFLYLPHPLLFSFACSDGHCIWLHFAGSILGLCLSLTLRRRRRGVVINFWEWGWQTRSFDSATLLLLF